MTNFFSNGKEFIQGIFNKGESFGEPVLLINCPYPATAIANEQTIILKLAKEKFLLLLRENEAILFSFAQLLAKRLFVKATLSKEISGEKPLRRVFNLLIMLKKESGCADEEKFKIELSRQRIADMLSLRVETVIRVMKKLHENGLIKIENRKVYL